MPQQIVHTKSAIAVIGGAQVSQSIISILQRHCTTFVAADGGADHLLRYGIRPAAIVGDMDSLSPDARWAFADVLMPVDDQDTTDFEKVMAAMRAAVILAAGFSGGRLDHTMAALNAMVRMKLYDTFILSDDDLCFLIRPGKTQFVLPVGTRVGLLPMGTARVTTTGLRWDLTDAQMATEGFISTSNVTADADVSINADGHLLVTLPLAVLDAVLGKIGMAPSFR